jgi:hypothetical protein
MKIAIHQPNFIPWVGYFVKIKHVDTFILYDTAQYTKNSFINRNKMVVDGMPKWLTVPVLYKGFSKCEIKQMQIDKQKFNPEKLSKTVKQEYRKYPHLEPYIYQFEEILKVAGDHQSLSRLNEDLIRWVCSILNIKTRIINASSLQVDGSNANDRILEICKSCGGTFYFSGPGGKKYLKEELFEKEGIRLEYFDHSQVSRKYGDLSVLHWLFREGREIEV